MTRTEIINSFIFHREYSSYLEIGVGYGLWNFVHVRCESKQGVDPNVRAEGVLQMASDAFFASDSRTFDLIFIDGLHEDWQVDRDIANALSRLNPGGVIVVHDCLPPDEWHQRGSAEFRPGDPWNGTVWKSVLRYFAASPFLCYVVDCDWGCGVIDTRGAASRPRREFPDQLDYVRDFGRLKEYVVIDSEFARQFSAATAPA